MTDNSQPDATVEDVMVPREQATPDHHAHAKTPKHLNEDELEHRVEQEREAVGEQAYDPDTVPDADA